MSLPSIHSSTDQIVVSAPNTQSFFASEFNSKSILLIPEDSEVSIYMNGQTAFVTKKIISIGKLFLIERGIVFVQCSSLQVSHFQSEKFTISTIQGMRETRKKGLSLAMKILRSSLASRETTSCITKSSPTYEKISIFRPGIQYKLKDETADVVIVDGDIDVAFSTRLKTNIIFVRATQTEKELQSNRLYFLESNKPVHLYCSVSTPFIEEVVKLIISSVEQKKANI